LLLSGVFAGWQSFSVVVPENFFAANDGSAIATIKAVTMGSLRIRHLWYQANCNPVVVIGGPKGFFGAS
jgi:hypothetical protein